MQKRAIFLDRDGIINQMVYDPEHGLVDSPLRPEEFVLLPGVGYAIRKINQAGFLVLVISNQPVIAKGKCSQDILDSITAKMHQVLQAQGAKLDGVYYCLHHPAAVLEEYRQNCNCRKPKPGLLIQAAREWDIDLSSSYFVGDGITDIAAGKAVGTTCLYVGACKEYITNEFDKEGIEPDYIVGSLLEAVGVIGMIEQGEPDLEISAYLDSKQKLGSRLFEDSQ